MYDDYDDDIRMPDVDDPTSADAEWKKIQQNTFTRWCNEHLKKVNLFIYDLETDLSDGLKLINLLQVLSHKKISRCNRKPSFRPQKLENIAIALRFIESEQIKLVNIDAGDILKGNLKLILGLIWTLILKYQISLSMMGGDSGGPAQTPKQALMGWVKSKLPPEISVKNFNKDWNDGIAIAGLVEASAPGLFPEWEDLLPENALENAKDAMKRAEDWLGVPQVITPEEITNPNVDELSVMTYVSYFPEAKLKPGAPVEQTMTDASKCSAQGPGLQEHGVVVNKPAEFTVTMSGSSGGKLSVQVFGPGGKAIDCMVQDNHDNTFTCRYEPPKIGQYDVHIGVGGGHIPKSPFGVNVGSDLDTTKVTATGPGLEPTGVIVGRPAKFEVHATGAGSGDLVIDVIDPKGNKKTELKVEDKGDNVYHCEYMPLLVGGYVIVIKYGGQEISKSPFHVAVTPAAARVKIFGPGLEAGLKTGKPATFTIDCSEAGDGGLDVGIEGPGRGEVKCEVIDNGNGTYTCTYKPTRPGTYTVTVKFDGEQVPKSPVKVAVGSTVDVSKIKAWGTGLEYGVAGKHAEFFVQCKGASLDNLSVGIEGPGEAKVEIENQDDGTVRCRYLPMSAGAYVIHIMYDEIDINNSPYTANISPPADMSKVYAEGPGLTSAAMAQTSCKFTVFTKGSGAKGKCTIKVVDFNGDEVESTVKDNGDGTFACAYVPKSAGKYVISIWFMDEMMPKAPITVDVQPFCDPSKVKATGPGLTGGKAEKPATFKIDASKAGDGGIGLTIEGPSEAEIKCDDHGDGTCSVEYFPVDDGEYTINITFADQHIPGSPFKPMISSDFDATKVLAKGPGLEPGNKAGKPCTITIDTRKAGKAKLGIEVTDENGNPVKADIVEEEPGLFTASYFPQDEGNHKISITFGGKPISKSPWKIYIKPAADPTKVKVSGPGIHPEDVRSNEQTYFEVDASEAGEGNVDIQIEPVGKGMPKVKDIDVTEGSKPNTYIVKYVAPEEGDYVINVTFAGVAVPKSPFKIKVKLGIDLTKIKVYGKGIEEPIVGQECPFSVDCPKEAGEKNVPLTATVESPTGRKIKVDVKANGDGTYACSWTPKEPGKHKITIKLGEDEVPGSPFIVDVIEKPDPSKVKCYGPGLEHSYVKQKANFTIETKNAGPGNLGLTIEGPDEAKIECQDNGDGTCTVDYIPFKAGEYDISVKFDDIHVPGSPFKATSTVPVDASKVKCTGEGLKKTIKASFPTEFDVDASEAGEAPLEVAIEGPGKDGKPTTIPVDIKDVGDGKFKCAFTPQRAGNYVITPKYGGNTVPGAPFKVSAKPSGDASKVKITGPGVKRPHVGHAAPFDADTTQAGEGNLGCNATGPNGEDIPVKIEEVEEGIFACEYTPEESGPHELEVLFGGEPVRGSPFKANAEPEPDLSKVKTPVLEEVLGAGPCVEQELEAPVDVSEVPGNKGAIMTGKITTPSKRTHPCDVKDNFDGTFALNYTPTEVGKYILEVCYDGIPIPGSPFEFEVTEGGPDKVKVTGKGIKKGIVAVPSRFTVDTKNAGPGDLSVAVEGPSKVDIECVDNGDGTCEVTYVPIEPGEYDVIIKFDNKPVPGSPFKPKVVQDEPAIETHRPSDLCMSPEELGPGDVNALKGVLESPTGKETPVEVAEGPNDSIIASFVPDEPGKNLLHLKKRNKPIKGSPIPIMVRDKPVIGKDSEIPLECVDCKLPEEIPGMKAILTRPNGKDESIPVKEAPDETIAVSFVPEEPGKHLIKVFKNGKQIDDSPFVVMVEGTPDQYPKVGKNCGKNYYQPEPCTKPEVRKMKAILRRPTGKEEPIEVELGNDDTIACSFIPTEAGEHLVSVKKDDRHIPNSPFSILVIDEPQVPTVGSECAANFDIPELDLPKDLMDLTGTLERPNGKEEPLKLSVGPDNSLAINFIPEEAGPHKVGIKKKGKHVKDSPFIIMVEEGKPAGPTVGHDVNANLDIPDISLPRDLPHLKGELERPTGKKEPLDLSVGPDNTLSLNFVPTEAGKHLIHLQKRGKPCKDSPYVIMVEEAKPGAGDGKPLVGRECGVNLDIPEISPRDIKNGDVKSNLTRPSGKKDPLECEPGPDDTLAVAFTPTEPGKHLIDVLKKGKPVKNSPFEIDVGPAPGKGGKPVDEDIVGPNAIREDECESGFPNGLPNGDGEPEGPCVGRPVDANLDIDDITLPRDLRCLEGELERPCGVKEHLPLSEGPDKTLALNFTPTEAGTHLVHLAKRGKPCKGSPYAIEVAEPGGKKKKPVDEGPCVGEKLPLEYDIPDITLPRDLKDLKAKLTRPTGKEEPIKCSSTPDNNLGLEFVPTEPGKHVIDVTKKGKPVAGSPFDVEVAPAKEPAPGEGGPSVGTPCDVNLDIDGFDPKDLKDMKAELTRPSGKKEPAEVKLAPSGALAIGFTPTEPGAHLLDVTKKGRPVKGSPFEIMVSEAGPGQAAKPTVGNKCGVDFDIPDVTLPGDLKDLTAKVTRPSGIQEPIECKCSPDNTLGLEFVPKEPGKHLIDVAKKGKPVRGSPFVVDVEDEVQASKLPTVGSECDVNLDLPDINPKDFKHLKGTIKRPGKTSEEPLELTLNPDNSIGVQFVPQEAGNHEIAIKKHGKHVTGSPFEVLVGEAPTAAKKPLVGSPCDLTLDMILTIEELKTLKGSLVRPDGQEEPITLSIDDKGHLIIKFTPKQEGLHIINIKRHGKHVPGSPIEVMVSSGDKKPSCDVGFEMPGVKLPDDLKHLKGSVVAPSGKEEPVELLAGPNNKTILVSFMPAEIGKHYIHIKKHGKHVGDSPFEVMVKAEDLAPGKADASKVKCYGKGLNLGDPNSRCEFTVDTREAGYGGLGLSVEGPSKVEINCIDNEDGTCSIDYTPAEPGHYLINVTYADVHVPGSPFSCQIGPVERQMVNDDIMIADTVDGEEAELSGEMSETLAFPSTKNRSPQDFVIKFTGSGDLNASVTRPSGVEDDAEVVETGPDTYTVRFVPRETGEHLVSVKSRRRHIPGSPFKVLVEAPAGGAAACRANGAGLEGGVAGQQCRFTVITRDAGPGGLAVAVEGPARAEIQCHDNGDGSCDITWFPVEAGEYTVHIRFADEAIPGSPFKVFVLPEDEGQAMSMESFREQVLRVGQQASFAVQMKGKKGKITSTVTSPSGVLIDCTAVMLEEGNYAVRFVPRELGDHLVSVYLDGHNIPGSPFTVKVGGLEGDPSKVTAYGPGLKGGIAGTSCEFTVNALDAGSGALALSIDGPAKVKMNCVEQDDGTYKVIYNPTVPGTYEISIRFAGQHIPDSPCKVRIAASEGDISQVFSDASQCTVQGMRSRAKMGEKNSFTVNTVNAGRGMIMVGVEGPVVPAKEICCVHKGGSVYAVNYILEEAGDYTLHVLWAGSHIPGSPFNITV